MGREGDATQRRSGARTDRSRPGRVRVGVHRRGQERARTEGGRAFPGVSGCFRVCGRVWSRGHDSRRTPIGGGRESSPPPEVPVRYRSAAAGHPRSSRRGPIPDPEGVVFEAVSAVLTPRGRGRGRATATTMPSRTKRGRVPGGVSGRALARADAFEPRVPAPPDAARRRIVAGEREGVTMGNHGRDSRQGVTAGNHGRESRQGITMGPGATPAGSPVRRGRR